MTKQEMSIHQKLKHEDHKTCTNEISSKTHYKNVFVVGAGFFLNFAAFKSLQNLQSSIHERPEYRICITICHLCWIYGILFICGTNDDL